MGSWDTLLSSDDGDSPDCFSDPEEYGKPRCTSCAWCNMCWSDICQEQAQSTAAFQAAQQARNGMPGVTRQLAWPPAHAVPAAAPVMAPAVAVPSQVRVPYPTPPTPPRPVQIPQYAPAPYNGGVPITRQVPGLAHQVQGVIHYQDGQVVLRLDGAPTPCFGEAVGEMLSTGLSAVAGDAARLCTPHANNGNLAASLLKGGLQALRQYFDHRRFRFGRKYYDPATRRWMDV